MMVAHTKRQAEIIAALQTKIEEASNSKDGTPGHWLEDFQLFPEDDGVKEE